MGSTSNDRKVVALLLIDMQKDFYTRIEDVKNAFPALPEDVGKLLQHFRTNSMPVIHVRAEYSPEVSPWFEAYHMLRPTFRTLNNGRGQLVSTEPEQWASEQHSEVVVVKHSFDGFLNTTLDEVLRQLNVDTLVVGGLVTSCCVLLTTVGAFFRGYKVIVVDDCCGDRTVERHSNTLALYQYMFSRSSLDTVLQCRETEQFQQLFAAAS